ncbi:hypothetical protein DNO68_22930, partial [Escherichia coli]|uniref:hypothetical protein n=1 Tax=Escherichia coli TaxID=562 RepID=UPI001594C3C1
MSLVKKNPSNLNRIIKGTKYSEAFMGKPTDEQRVIIENANANNMVIAAPSSLTGHRWNVGRMPSNAIHRLSPFHPKMTSHHNEVPAALS